MIEKLQHNKVEVAKKIWSVFQVSYAVEAKLLNVTDFPPLRRPLNSYVKSKTAFFAYLKNREIAGVVEITHTENYTHINSLVVDPKFFRQGVGSQLVEFVFNSYDSDLFIVETGFDNVPAKKLYVKFGFVEVKQWDTKYGIRKIKFEKRSSDRLL